LPLERVEDFRLLRGEGRFVDDLHVDGMLHAAFVRSPLAHGRILGIDTRSACSLSGIRAVFTAADVAGTEDRVPIVPLRAGSFPQVEPYGMPVIAHHKVRYVGEPIAIVIADSAALAEDGADAVEVDFEPLQAIIEPVAALRGEVLLFENTGSNAVVTYHGRKGNVVSAAADYRRRERFRIHRHMASFMEPRGLLADWDGAGTRMNVTGSAKSPYANRRALAACMDLPEDCIQMHWSDFGGGFGSRGEFYPEDYLVPFASRRLGRPVKWIEDRRENLLTTNHSRDVECELEIGCERDGRIVYLTGQAYVNVGAYFRMSGAVQPRNLAQFIAGIYRVPHVSMDATVVVTNKTPSGVFRGPGRYEADYFRERLFDMAAADLKLDPVEFRRRNLVTKAELPYPVPTLTPIEANDELDSGDYAAVLDRCLAEFDWLDKAPLQGKPQRDGRYHGMAVGCFVEGGAAGPRETARILAERDGSITVHVGAANIGQGMETAFSQIAADALGVAIDRIRVRHGGTGVLKEGFGSFHSRSTVMAGSAILNAAQILKMLLGKLASSAFGCSESEVQVDEDLIARHGNRALTLAELVASTRDEIAADGVFHNHHHTYANGAAAAHVAVDPGTGEVELLDYVTVQDVGRAINPLTLAGQAVGAVVQGLGGVFLEHLVYDEQGQLLSGNLADYLLPTATDFPRIRAIVLQDSPAPHNPLGAKGAGEGGIVPVAGVIANAVSAALSSFGVQVRDLPLSPPQVWALAAGRKLPGETS